MRHFITKAPAEGDCFFHVVAYFLNGDINDPRAAQEIRRGLARQAAKDLFDMTLEDLTNAVLNSNKIDDLPLVLNTSQAQILQGAFNNGPAQDANNKNNCPLAVFVVWLQWSWADIAEYRKKFSSIWLREN
ncbi:MAG: hypothetical protein K2Q10_12460, partial [Rhodospirillales bacterium]|nr:hypothetical protein [Rhodospirillales bacterium]